MQRPPMMTCCAISRDRRSRMHGARPTLLRGGAADGGGPMRAGVGDRWAALRDRAGGQRQASRCARTTATSLGAGSAGCGETASVPTRATGGGVTQEPARCSHRLRAAQMGRPDALHGGRAPQDRLQRGCAEQALRPIVLGRKNWLFAGSEAAAHRTAILCSLV